MTLITRLYKSQQTSWEKNTLHILRCPIKIHSPIFAVHLGRVGLGSSGLGGLLRFRRRRSIGLIQIRMSHPSSSEKFTDEFGSESRKVWYFTTPWFGWPWHPRGPWENAPAGTGSRIHKIISQKDLTTPSSGSQSNGHGPQLISSYERRRWMSPIERAFTIMFNVVYRPVRGLAMGNNLAPPLAIIFMSQLECRAMESFPVKPKLYRRYIDDSLVLWQHGMSSLMEFVNHLSGQHSDIEFTVQHSRPGVTSAVLYLDLSIRVTDGRLEWELFVKESHSGVHLSFCSGLPMDVKMAVARNQFRRQTLTAATKECGGDRRRRLRNCCWWMVTLRKW